MQVTVINQQDQGTVYDNVKSFQVNEKSLCILKQEGQTMQTMVSLSHEQFANVKSVAVII